MVPRGRHGALAPLATMWQRVLYQAVLKANTSSSRLPERQFPRGFHSPAVTLPFQACMTKPGRPNNYGGYTPLHSVKLGANDVLGRGKLCEVSASCAHLESKGTVFHS